MNLTQIQWYFVPDTNGNMPFASRFYSRIYERDDPPDPVGETAFGHTWRGGKPPGIVAVGGLCGSADQWANGALTTDPKPDLWPNTDSPKCCIPPLGLFGGFGIGGVGVPLPTSGETGCNLFPVMPFRYQLTVSGVVASLCTGPDCPSQNGTWIASYYNGCLWIFTKFVTPYCGGQNWSLQLYVTSGTSFIQSAQWGTIYCTSGPWSPFGINTFRGSGGGPYCTGTITILVQPAP